MEESKKIIKICSIYGSPKLTGFSSRLHDTFLSAVNSSIIEKHIIHSMNILHCTGCCSCNTTGSCVYNDDMNQLLLSAHDADLISISFPLYFTSLPGPLKTAVDRFQPLWMSERNGKTSPVRNKQCILFITAGSDYTSMFEPSLRVVSHVVRYVNAVVNQKLSVLCPGLDAENSGSRYADALASAVCSAKKISDRGLNENSFNE